MLTNLIIKNYALIDHLNVDFDKGLISITGETGAGKSILLGGLSLVLGKRADLSSIKDATDKCVIEASFAIGNYKLEDFFNEQDLDFEQQTIIRREILPSGKSRAFVNDTPVTLDVLSSLGGQLIDIHSQHQTLKLTDNDFQFQVIDAIADVSEELNLYTDKLTDYLALKKELKSLIEFQQQADKDNDYNSFLLEELRSAKLKKGMLADLEATFEQLNNVDEIANRVTQSLQLFSEEQMGVLPSLNEIKSNFNRLSGFGKTYKDLSDRIDSVLIELDDVFNETLSLEESLEADPVELEKVNEKLQLIYNLQKKHNVLEVTELIEIQEQLEIQVSKTQNLESDIKEMQLKLMTREEALDKIALELHNKRTKGIPALKDHLENTLASLGMPNAQFEIELTPGEHYHSNGKDNLSFLFSANKGGQFNELKKAASGGELSRIMLAIKSLLAQYMHLPTIMFDEIDTGVSGEVSNKMADIMYQMSKTMQVFTITHLPQVAAKGDQHYKVYKEEVQGITTSQMKKLNQDQRVIEIAEMLGGKDISSSARAHANELLIKRN
ncbi:DNA repair protein RecN [Galbibacter marinus]|uniref:DNA repair protein RecN n=1 Tax=Galbibacter marinus TaxID=555500 RepID=K2Q3F4_9FLAO|nr:DNA repair protein RecN [Galbibacter marinus]EKF55376.1 DNA repair protein RecN [Galbibacter marinus]